MVFTQNDVIDFSQFYKGADEPPRFYREHFDVRDKAFIPNDDVSLAQKLGIDTRKNGILHYFSNDGTQNRLIRNPHANDEIHAKFYAVCTPDFSVDSSRCFSCFHAWTAVVK